MKKFAKILVLLLTVALICGAIAMVASADDTEAKGADLSEAIANPVGGKVTLTGNSFLPAEVTVNSDLTIDLAGYTLTLEAANAFNVTGNVNFNIEGNYGKIELAGALLKSGMDVKPNVVISDAQINHYGSAVANDNYTIIDVCNGNYSFVNVHIVSTANVTTKCYTDATLPYEAFINMSRIVTGNSSDSTNVAGANVTFESSSFQCETSFVAGVQPAAGFSVFNVVGDGRVTVKNSYVKNAGSVFRLGYARPLTEGQLDGNVQNVTVENSTLITNPLTSQGTRDEFIWGHKLDGGNSATYGVYYFKDSFLSCDGYRFAHFGTDNATGTSKIVLDGSVIRNGMGNTTDNDSMLSRATSVYLKNQSAIVSHGSNLAGNGAVIYVEKGTRFNITSTIYTGGTAIKEYDFTTNTIGASVASTDLVYDPAGNRDYPYVYGGTASSILPEGADKIEYATYNYMGGGGNRYGIVQDGNGTPSWQENDFFQYSSKLGAVYDVTYGSNTSFKYWVSPDASDATSTLGSPRKYTSDPFIIVGNNTGDVASRFAQYGVHQVVVYTFDVATDSEYGYVESLLQVGGRSSGGNKADAQWAELKPDGTINNFTLKDFPDGGVKLSTDTFNTITLVAFIGEAGSTGTGFFYVNGKYIGYDDILCGAGVEFLQGVRFNPKNNFTHTVGQSILIDNVTRTRYTQYLDGANTVNKASADAYAPAYVKNTNPVNENYIAGGKAYAYLDDAINGAFANETQVVPVNAFVSSETPLLVEKNVKIGTWGNSLNIADGSYPSVIVGDKNAPSAYNFDAAYSDYAIYYYWLRPGYSADDEIFGDGSWEDEPEKYFYIQELKAGMTPAPEEGMVHFGTYNAEDGSVMVHNGKWSVDAVPEPSVFEPLSLDYVIEMEGSIFMIAPYYEKVTDALYVVLNAEDKVLRIGNTNQEFTDEFKTVNPGETKTITLLDDAALTSANHRLSGGSTPAVTNVNLNGKKMEWRAAGSMAFVGSNMTLNVYSTAPGAELYHAGWRDSGLVSQRIFAISGGSGEDLNTMNNTHDAHINIGTVEGIEGSNGKYLTVYTSIIAEGITGNDTCSITIDGIYAETYKYENGGMVITRFYNGDITIKNSTLINYYGPMVRFVAQPVTPYVLFDNCTIIHLGTDNLFNENGQNNNTKQLEFRNCVITCAPGKGISTLNSNRTVFSGTNIVSDTQFTNDAAYAASYTDGVKVFAYNAPVTLASLGFKDEGGYAKITRLAGSSANDLHDVYYAVVEYGVTMTEEQLEELGLAGVYTLPQYFKYAITDEANAVPVTWKDTNGDVLGTENFYTGPTAPIGNNTPASAFAGATLTVKLADVTEGLVATKKAFAGWDKGVNIKEAVVLNPVYETVANLENVKANISLYSDFGVNLYIPEVYKNFVTVKYGDKTLNAIETGREGYFRVSVEQLASEAASDVQFVVTVTEGGETVTVAYNVNVAVYAEYVLASAAGYTEADKTLMQYVVAYANEAYKYANNGEANATLEALATKYAATATVKNYTAITNPEEVSAVVKEAVVILESAPKFAFTIDKDFVGTVEIGGKAYTYAAADAEDRVVFVDGVRAFNFLDDITIKVGEKEGKYNFSAYAAYHADNAENGTDEASKAESAKALALIDALYEYVNYAKTYNANKAQ